MSTWLWLRAAGIGSYVALFSSVAWGLVATTGVVTKRVSKPASNHFHAATGVAGLVMLAVHLALLMIHDFMPFDLADVLVPWGAPYRPVAVGFGVVAMYMAIAVVASSWVRKRLSTRMWRAMHLIATPAFLLALLHGVFAGTDTNEPWMVALYGITGLVTVFLLLVRGMTARMTRAGGPRRTATGGNAG
ncbi:MAG: ferric reductase-like transmembrane domain-containing protein, partial [Actinomycetota bacterium]